MKISEISIKQPVFSTMVVAAMVVFGLVAYNRIGVDLFPSVDFPIVTVSVFYEGSDPETIETDVTEPIEEAVNTISGIKSLRSESVTGLSMTFVEFELGRNIDIAAQDVRDKVAAIRADLPKGIDPPVVEKFDPDSAPIMSITLAGTDSIRELTQYADNVIKPQIEGVDGVGAVEVVGGRDREIRIWLRVDDLRGYALTASDVVEAIEKENVEFPGGRVETTCELVVKTKGRIERPADFENIVVAHRQGTPIRLKDVATVEDGMEDFRSLSRLNSQRAVSLQVRRQSGENMLAVATEVKKRLANIESDLPDRYELTMTQDLSLFVADSVNEAQGELLRGGVLAVLVILLFLRSWPRRLRGSRHHSDDNRHHLCLHARLWLHSEYDVASGVEHLGRHGHRRLHRRTGECVSAYGAREVTRRCCHRRHEGNWLCSHCDIARHCRRVYSSRLHGWPGWAILL